MDERGHTDDSNRVETSSDRLTRSLQNLTEISSINAKSEDLLQETKYVMLNFMSLVPPRLYKDHVQPSPDLSKQGFSTYGRFSKSHPFLGKSKSFDVASGRSHRQNPLLKAQMLDREINSPASEDNVNYRYKVNRTAQDQMESSPSTGEPEGAHNFDQVDTVMKSQKFNSQEELSSGETSPRKIPESINRLYSDTSSCGNYSYVSDADDEYEVSHSSSVFSSASLNQQDGFLDLRTSSNYVIPECKEENEKWRGNRESTYILPLYPMAEEDGLDDTDGPVMSMPGRTDRSNLKLNIQPQPVVLDDVLLSFQSEIHSELSEMEPENDEAVKNVRDAATTCPCLTPTQAAKILARIGDEVKEEYCSQISSTISQLFIHKIGELSYQQFKDISNVMIDNQLPEWRQVALLMVYGQGAAWYAIQGGHKNIGNIVDHCSRLVFDVAADFIIKEGGWGSVMNFDPSQSSDTQSSVEFDSPAVDYFTSHNTTRVESGMTTDKDRKPTAQRDHDINLSDPVNTVFQVDEYIQSIPSLDCDTNPYTERIHNTLGENPGLQTYTPSIGFDFRIMSPATEGSLQPNQFSDDTIDFVVVGDDDGQFDVEGKIFDLENNDEDVFPYDHGSVGSEVNRDGESEHTLHINSVEFYGNQVRMTEAIQSTTSNVPSSTGHSTQPENNITDSSQSDMKAEEQSTIENQTNEDNLKEQDERTSTDRATSQSKPQEGYLGGNGTKLMVMVGAVAALGLGLKLGAFNR